MDFKLKILSLLLLLSVSGRVVCQSFISGEDSSNLEVLDLKRSTNRYFLFPDTGKYVGETLFTGIDTVFIENDKDSIKLEIRYINGIKVKSVGYYNNDFKYRETFFNKYGIDGTDTRWYKNEVKSFQTSYKNNIRITPLIEWFPNRELKSFSDFNSQTNKGLIKKWNDKGVLIEETKSIDTTDAGLLIISFFDSGKLKTQSIFNNGKQSYAAYYEDGSSLFVKGNILNAYWNKVGLWTEYFVNGKIKSVISYLDADDINNVNIKDGISKIWNKQGDLIKEEVYKNGELIDTKEYLPLKKK